MHTAEVRMYAYRPSRQVMPIGERPVFINSNQQLARRAYLRWFDSYRRETDVSGH